MPDIPYNPPPDLPGKRVKSQNLTYPSTRKGKADITDLKEQLLAIGIVARPGLIESYNFVAGTSGWQLTAAGVITALSGAIGGWTITSSMLHSDNKIALDSSNQSFWINNSTFANSGIQLEYNSGNPRAYMGDGATNYFKYEGGAVTISGSLVAGEIHIPDLTTANSFHTNSTGNSWWGCNVADFNTDPANAPAYVLSTGVAKFSTVSLTGSLSVSTSGSISSGQTAYNTGIGYWIEYNGGNPRFSIGNPAGNYLTWDASILTVKGVVIATTATITGTTTDSFTINDDLDDVDVDLVFGRTTGGNLTLRYDGLTLNTVLADGREATIIGKSVATTSIYVTTGGSDTTGDGSSGNPWATVQHAVDSLPEFLNSTVYIYVGAGTFAGYNIYKHALGDEQYIIVRGTTNAIVAEQTATGGTRETITKTGAGWTIDAYQGKFFKVTGGTGWVNDTTFPYASNCYPIARNTADTIRIASHTIAFDNTTEFEIVEMATYINASRCVNVVATIPLVVYLVNQKYASTTSSGTCIYAKNSEVRVAGAHFLRTATYQTAYDHYQGAGSANGVYLEGSFNIGVRIRGIGRISSTYGKDNQWSLYADGNLSETTANGLFIEGATVAITSNNYASFKIVHAASNSYFDDNTYVFRSSTHGSIEALQPTVKTFATINGTKVLVATGGIASVNNLVTATNSYEFSAGLGLEGAIYNETDGLEMKSYMSTTIDGSSNITIGTDANLIFAPTGDFYFNPTGNDILPTTGYDLNLGSLAKKYLTLHCAELWVETLVAQNTIATIGGRILVGPTTALTSDLASGDTTIYVKHNEMANGDRVYMEADGKVEFMSIDSAPGGAGPYTYTVTRNLDGTGANQWYAGDAIFNTGTTGDGFIDIYSVSGVKAGTEYGPAIAGNVRNSATYNDWSTHWAIGELNGLYGYGAATYGVGLGEYAASKTHVTLDSTNGLRFFYGTGTVIGQWDASGNITVGQVAANQSNVYITSGAVHLRNNTTDKIVLNADGTAFFAGAIMVGDGTSTSGTITLNHYATGGDTYFAGGTITPADWTAQGGFIMGIDDSDSDKVKFYFGDSAAGQFVDYNVTVADAVTVNGIRVGTAGYFEGDGSDGALSTSSGTTNIDASGANIVTKQYTSISITGAAILALTNKATDGTILILKSRGDVTISGTIDLDGDGADGGAGGASDGVLGFSIVGTGDNYGDSGGNGVAGGAGGVGGTGSARYDARGLYAPTCKLYNSTVIVGCGSGGGGGGDGTTAGGTSDGGTGGAGGGCVIIMCGGALNFTGTINVRGEDGEDGDDGAPPPNAPGGGGGGGGSAGMCVILYNELTAASGTINAYGGGGGDGGDGSGGFGGGGGGGEGGASWSDEGSDGGAGGNDNANGTNGTASNDGSGGGGGGGGGGSDARIGGTGGASSTTDSNHYLIQLNEVFA